MPSAGSTESSPTDHVTFEDASGNKFGLVLVDGRGNQNHRAITRTPIQRTSVKTQQGGTKHSDFSEPFFPIPQDDWSGGRGQEDFERDRSRFFDSYRVNTWMANQVILGPQETYTSGVRDQDQNMPGSVAWQDLSGATRFIAVPFTPAANYTAASLQFWARWVSGDKNSNHLPPILPRTWITASIWGDTGGEPNTVIGGISARETDFDNDAASKFYKFTFFSPLALTQGTQYWAVVHAAGVVDTWQVGTNAASGTTMESSAGSSWSSSSFDLYFRVTDVDDDREHIMFDYQQGLYCVSKPTDGSAAQIWINGDRGTADSNSGALSNLKDATKSWTAGEFTNAVVTVTGGTGSEEVIPWRLISGNSSAALTVTPDYNIQHDETTEYVIAGGDTWIEVTGSGLTVPVTDVLVSKNFAYFAQGDSVAMRRFQASTVTSAWTNAFAADGTNKATFLELVEDPVDGQQVWKGNNDTTSVARADAVATGSLAFGTAITVGNTDTRLTGMDRYGSPEVLWVLKDDSQWAVQNDIPDQIPLREMASVRSSKNGKAHVVHGVYLYFSLLHSLERYFRNNLDDVGPSLDFGLPADRQGPIVDLEGYPGFFLAAIDGGTSNYSSILVTSGSRDWHEIYRAPQTGQRIRNLHFQVISGSTIDRLWFSQGTDICWIPFPSDTLDPFRDSNYTFTHEGHLITSWMYADLQDVNKLWKSVKVFAENLTASSQIVECDYQTDGDTETSAWTAVNGTFDTVPVEEIDLVADIVANPVTGRRIRFRFRFYTDDNSKTPRMKATVAEALGRISTKYKYAMTFRARDEALDIEGDDASYTAVETLMAQLDTWATSATPLTMECIYSPFDNKTVLIEAASLQPVSVITDDQIEVHVGQLEVTEI